MDNISYTLAALSNTPNWKTKQEEEQKSDSFHNFTLHFDLSNL
jgi:hypothetical protein